jgi:prepilin-type N-terminal cleavage/methylation domain-containing protein
MRTSTTKRRSAFTLVELLVVIGIILIIAALGVTMLPRFQQDQKVQRGADQLQQFLLIARQRAKRDQLATGVRLYITPGSNLVNQLAYIQQPAPFTGGNLTSASVVNGIPTVNFDPNTVDLVGASGLDLSLVQAGDYLQISDGPLHYIQSVNSPTQLTLPAVWPIGSTNPDANNNLPTLPNITTPTQDWQILRGPRRFEGEDIITMYQDMVIDVNATPTYGSMNLPATKVISGPLPYTSCIDILFSPSGGVVGTGGMGGKMVLWVRDSTAVVPTDPGAALLVAIQLRTGFISAAPVNVNGDPYAFTKNGRGSGL